MNCVLYKIVFITNLVTFVTCYMDTIKSNVKDPEISYITNGLEFNGVSREGIMKLIATFNQKILQKHRGEMLFYGLWVMLTYLGVGLAFGFSAVCIPQLQTKGSDVTVTPVEANWIVSILTLVSPIGSILSGVLLDRVGRRIMLISAQLPMFIGWLVISMAPCASIIIIGRSIVGIGFGMCILPPRVYMSECSLPNMRGVVGALPISSNAIGITIQASLGSFLSWRILGLVSSIYSLVILILYFLLPESPYFHLMKGNLEEARESVKKFRSEDYDHESEIEAMIEYKIENDIRRLTPKQIIPALLQVSSVKPFCIINIYMLFSQLSGMTVFTFWAVEIIQKAQDAVNPKYGNIITSATRIVFGVLCSVLLYRVGRRQLSFISGIGAGLSFIFMGLIGIYKFKFFHYMPFFCCVFYIAFASIGFYGLPLLLMSEMYPLQVRGILGAITVTLTNLTIFVSNNLYPLSRNTFGFPYTVIGMGCISLLGVIYLFFFLPETKDLTMTEIEEYFNGRVAIPISQKALKKIQLSKPKK